MNDLEFNEWLKIHSRSFDGLNRWLDNRGIDEQKQVKQAWFDVLRWTKLEDAKAATAAMFASTDQPKWWDKHPAAIKELASKIRSDLRRGETKEGPKVIGKNADGTKEVTYACGWCRDSGWVDLWTRRSFDLYERDPDGFCEKIRDSLTGNMEFDGSITVRCACDCGGQYSSKITRYDPSRHRRKDWWNALDSFLNWRKYQRAAPVEQDDYTGMFEEAETF